MFNYCPNCSIATADSEIFPFRCHNCGFTYFHNTASAVAAIIEVGDEILLTQRAKDPGKGKWDLPGGFVDHGESLESALKRELQEELGIDVPETAMTYLCSEPNVYEYKGVTYQTCDTVFVVSLNEKTQIVKQEQEVLQFDWVAKSTFNLEQLAFLSIQRALQKHFNR